MDTQTATIASLDPPSRIFDAHPEEFRANFNRASFAFAHRLAGHPLFELPRLMELAKSMSRKDNEIYYDAGDVAVGQRWNEVAPTDMTVDQLIDRIENSGAWIAIKRAHHDRSYAALLDQGIAELDAHLGGALPSKMKKRDAYIFITSPNRKTAFHIDRECNFLMQVRGDKVIHLFNKYDREVLPEEEIERFWTVDNNAAVYKPEYQGRAKSFDLTPGVGVHIPVNAPHWVQNGNNISVTLAVTFQFVTTELANIYRANYYLRKMGIVPLPPGKSKVSDFVKANSYAAAATVRRVALKLRGE